MLKQPLKVNGTSISQAEILDELTHHQQADDPWDMAVSTLVVRRLLLDEAQRLGLSADSEEALFALLLQQEVVLPTLTDEECLRHYEKNLNYFKVGASVDADHILIQSTSNVNKEALEKKALAILEEVLLEPDRFAQFAHEYSNCPSSEEGGYLGTLLKGQTVPEFEEVVFRAEVGRVHPALVESRFGFHIVRVQQRVEGEILAYEEVADRIYEALQDLNQNRAWRQYIQHIAKEGDIEGFDYESLMEENLHLG